MKPRGREGGFVLLFDLRAVSQQHSICEHEALINSFWADVASTNINVQLPTLSYHIFGLATKVLLK